MTGPVPAEAVRLATVTAVRAGCVLGVAGAALVVGTLSGMPVTGRWLWLAATVLVAGTVMATGSWTEQLANRVAFGPDGDAYAQLTAFADRISDTLAVDDVLPRVAQTVTQATHSAGSEVRLWLPAGGELRESWPLNRDPGAVLTADVRLRHRGEEVGALGVTTAGGRLPDDTRMLLDRLAGTAGLALANVRLAYDLRERIAESMALTEALQRSRQRLVDAAAEETQRFSALVADRVQQRLHAADRALDEADRGDPTSLAEAATCLRGALEELRDLAAGVFPPTLSDNGLAVALETLAARYAGRVAVRQSGAGPRPTWSVEAAAYRCAWELVDDAAADSAGVTVEVDHDDAGFFLRLDLERRPSFGVLQLLRDRVDATDGSIEILPRPSGAQGHRVTLSWRTVSPAATPSAATPPAEDSGR